MFQRCVETTVEIEIKHFREDHSSKPQWRFAHNTRFWSGQIRQHLGPLRKVFNFLVSYMEKTPPNSKGPSGYEGRRLQRFAKRFFATQRLTTCLSTSYIHLEFIWPIQLWYLDYKKHLLAIDVKITYLIHTCSFLFTLQTICLPFSPLSRRW